jgi:hypothetical protein
VVVQQVMVQLSYPAIILPYQGAASMTEGWSCAGSQTTSWLGLLTAGQLSQKRSASFDSISHADHHCVHKMREIPWIHNQCIPQSWWWELCSDGQSYCWLLARKVLCSAVQLNTLSYQQDFSNFADLFISRSVQLFHWTLDIGSGQSAIRLAVLSCLLSSSHDYVQTS